MGERRHSALFSCQKNEKEISIALLVRCTIIRNCTIANLFCRISYNAVDAFIFVFARKFLQSGSLFSAFLPVKRYVSSRPICSIYIYICIFDCLLLPPFFRMYIIYNSIHTQTHTHTYISCRVSTHLRAFNMFCARACMINDILFDRGMCFCVYE